MGGDGVSDVSAGAGEVGMVNGTGLTSRFIARSGVCGGRDLSTMSWQRLGVFGRSQRRGLVRMSCVDGSEERIWKPSLRIHFRQ